MISVEGRKTEQGRDAQEQSQANPRPSELKNNTWLCPDALATMWDPATG